MAIQLTVIKSPQNVSMMGVSKTFSEQGGTLGRGASNDWVLEDPDRYLSSSHCEITFESGEFYIIDRSTNGTFVNESPQALGKGGRSALYEGDIFEVGDYKFSINIVSSDSSVEDTAMPADPFTSQAQDPFAPPVPDTSPDAFTSGSHLSPERDPFSSTDDPLNAFADAPSLDSSSEQLDPIAALDKASGIMAPAKDSEPFGSGSHHDGAKAINESVAWPSSSQENQIPDDWEDDLNLRPTPDKDDFDPAQNGESQPPLSPFEDAKKTDSFDRSIPLPDPPRDTSELPVDLPHIPQPVAEQSPEPPSGKNVEGEGAPDSSPAKSPPDQNKADLQFLFDSMGLDVSRLTYDEKCEIHRQVGAVMRVSITGMMQVLRARASIKNEFRMDVTTIQPLENNPLKFSADIDEAMENLFIRQSKAYLGPLESVQESYDGIAEHQVAIIAGIRAAFDAVMECFNPERLEDKFSRGGKSVSIPGMQNARNWSNYCHFYNDLVNNMEQSFQYLFGDEFVQAYEDQLRRLAIARKTKK